MRSELLQIGAEAVALRAVLPVLLRVLPLQRTLRLLTPTTASMPAGAGSLEAIERVTDTLTRRLPGLETACLKRALMRFVLLRRRGYPARFAIGVRPGGPDGFEAHAWVMLGAETIMETSTASYRSTLVWPVEA